MKLPKKRTALLVPDDASWEYNYGMEDYAFYLEHEETLYIEAEKGELYPGCIVVIKPTTRKVRGFECNDLHCPNYWEIEK